MAVILITHDLTIVRQFSDYVYVMQNGLRAGAQHHRSPVPQPASMPTPSTCWRPSPRGHANPIAANSPTMLEGRDVKVAFTLEARRLSSSPISSSSSRRRQVEPQPAAARDAGARRRVRLGQDHLRPGADPADRQPGRRNPVRWRAHRQLRPQGHAAVAQPHADRLPGSVCVAQPAHVDPPDHRGRADRQQYRRATARRIGSSGCARRCATPACPTPSSAVSRTNSRAASGSASPSPAPSRSSRSSSCSTSPPRRSTCRCRPRSSTCCASCRTKRA